MKRATPHLAAAAALLHLWLQPAQCYSHLRASELRARASRSLAVAPRARARVSANSVLHSLLSAYDSGYAAYPLRVNALVTGSTCLLGDAIAQGIERGKSAAAAEGGQDVKRSVRMFATGFLVLGPLAHFYYAWMSAQLDLAMSAKIFLDNTIFLGLDNLMFWGSITLLGGGLSADSTAGAVAVEDGTELAGALNELWSMQLTGWKFFPLIAILNYALVPPDKRVLFIDIMDVVYAALLSLHVSTAAAALGAETLAPAGALLAGAESGSGSGPAPPTARSGDDDGNTEP